MIIIRNHTHFLIGRTDSKQGFLRRIYAAVDRLLAGDSPMDTSLDTFLRDFLKAPGGFINMIDTNLAQRIKDKKLFTAHEIAGALVRSAEFQTAQMKNEESLSSAVEFEAISKSNRARVKVGTGSFF